MRRLLFVLTDMMCLLGPDEKLPSGEQPPEQWCQLEDQLYFVEKNNAKRATEKNTANAKNKKTPVILDGAGGGADKGKAKDDEEEGSPAESAAASTTVESVAAVRWVASQTAAWEAEKRANGKVASTPAPDTRAAELEAKISALGPEPVADSADRPNWMAKRAALTMAAEKHPSIKQEKGVEGGEAPEDAEDDDKLTRPSGWVHSYSLVFALFGRPAGKHEDVDLKVAMSTGPGKQGRRAHSASPTPSRTSDEDTRDTSNDPLGKRGLQTMDGAGGIGGFASREK
ncbi:unnamed protein product [Ectocarpus sp. CCAP 1310/34]|nr:unnamed protein product [Ectocarpus sp. CCAP 1310/34]